jgi:hypothetical protein
MNQTLNVFNIFRYFFRGLPLHIDLGCDDTLSTMARDRILLRVSLQYTPRTSYLIEVECLYYRVRRPNNWIGKSIDSDGPNTWAELHNLEHRINHKRRATMEDKFLRLAVYIPNKNVNEV